MKPIDAIFESKNDLALIHDRCLVVTGRIINCDWPWERTQESLDVMEVRQRLNDAVMACQRALAMIGVVPPVTMLEPDALKLRE